MATSENDAATPSRQQRAFAEMLQALARPQAFPDGCPGGAMRAHAGFMHDTGQIEIVQTHASAVLLAGDRAYKLKKPNDFGFFDYSTPALRRHFCGEEVRLNARLAPYVYLGVAPVLALPDGSYRFAHECAPDLTPAPGDPLDDGRVVDYAVVMIRLPEEATLEARVHADDVQPELLAAVANRVAEFHAASRTGEDIAEFGALDVIKHNWDENFEQMAPYVGRALDAATFDRLREYVYAFLRTHRVLFESRVRNDRIRDCHGDLRMQHIYVLDDYFESVSSIDRRAQRDTIAIIDCIEFNERFRYGDVVAEVAFLTMELDAAGRPDLARSFTDAYIAETGDDSLRALLPFYACYRACVRGKVLAFQLDEPEVPVEQREAAQRQARLLFALAERYATGPATPMLLLVGGLMGVGKSTLARQLAHELGWALLASDAIRKELAGVAPAQAQDISFGQGMYAQDWTAKTYGTLAERAATMLAEGRSVILDASFARKSDRQAAAELAGTVNASAWFVECVCPREVALQRLANRWRSRRNAHGTDTLQSALEQRTESAVLDASDGRPELYAAQEAIWQPFSAAAEPALVHIRIDTGGSAAIGPTQVMDALGIAQSACWL